VGCFEGVGGIVQSAKDKTSKKTEAPAASVEIKNGSEKDTSAEANSAAKAGEAGKGAKAKADEVLGRCCACEVPWDRYVGKKKCAMCGVPVLLCVACSSARGMLDKAQEDKGKGASTAAAASASATTGKWVVLCCVVLSCSGFFSDCAKFSCYVARGRAASMKSEWPVRFGVGVFMMDSAALRLQYHCNLFIRCGRLCCLAVF
jgi:hypothetical protein